MNDVLARVGDRWSVQIVYVLARGTMRFNELKRELGISQRMLSQSLRDLERDGLILRRHFATIPPRVEYELTALGLTFCEPVMALAQWAFDHQSCIEANRRAFVDPCPTGESAAEDVAL
jgi:DNA-binding HxlR family transcriptional regulator